MKKIIIILTTLSIVFISISPVLAQTWLHGEASGSMIEYYGWIYYSVGANGSISDPHYTPPTNCQAFRTTACTFLFLPDTGYYINRVIVNGVNVGTPTSYTINPQDRPNPDVSVFFSDTPPPPPPPLPIFSMGSSTITDLLAYTDQLFTDSILLIVAAVGIPFGFYIIRKLIGLVPKGR